MYPNVWNKTQNKTVFIFLLFLLTKLKVIKLFGDNFFNSNNDLCHLSRDTTIDSIELINNYTMAPSYSEAILGDRFPLRTDISNHLSSDKNSESVYSRSSNRLRNSLSRTSLRNGQIVYFVSPISNENQNNVIRRLSLIDNNDNTADTQTEENPPTYEEVLLESHPLQHNSVLNLNPLRRSLTDRDFFRRLSNHFRRQWNSYVDIQLGSNETQLWLKFAFYSISRVFKNRFQIFIV